MPAWPKSFITFGASLLTTRTAMRLRSRDSGRGTQARAFRILTRTLATTSAGAAAGVESGMTYETFRSRVALRTYESLQPDIERMQRGETNVLWPGPCTFFVTSAGTSLGAPKILPITTPMLRHFSAGYRHAMLYYTARTGHAGVFCGRHLFLTGPTAMQPLPASATGHQAFAGEWPAVVALSLPPWAERHLFEPGADIAALTDWQAKLDATIARTAGRDISLLAGIAPWVLTFIEALRANRAAAGHPIGNLQALWPNLECYIHAGVPIGPYQSELRALLGPTVKFHEVHVAAEGFFGAQDSSADAGLRLLHDLGFFFEFLPLAEYDEKRIEQLGERAVPLADVRTGVDYLLLITSPAGLCRYVVGDVIRFTSTEPPRYQCVGRAPLLLNAFGERVIEKEVTDALMAVCSRHRWSIVNFHVAPLFGNDLTGQARGRHEWWVELRPGTVETPTGPQMAAELDLELQRLNPEYAARRRSNRIDAPFVRLVMPGVFRHWQRFHHRWGGQNKIARCRSDRVLASELAHITRFAQD
jgi:hypothetical protein